MMTTAGSDARVLRGALLGTGSISIHHMIAWQAIEGARIVALANRTRSKAEEMGARFGVGPDHIYSDYRELLEREDLDFVDIATAPPVHREQVLAAAAKGVHVLCQKPFATSVTEATEMVNACEDAEVRCVVNENWRWRRWYREAKGILASGLIGQPRYARFQLHDDRVLPRADGALPPLLARLPYAAENPSLILSEWGIHLIDVMRFLLGDVRQVYAWTSRTSPLVRGEDMALVQLRFNSGAVGVIDISWGSRVSVERRTVRGNVDPFLVEGDLGSLELDPYQDDLLIISTADGTRKRPARGELSPGEAYQESYYRTQSHFLERLRSGEQAENEARDNLKTLAITMAAYESARLAHPVDVTL